MNDHSEIEKEDFVAIAQGDSRAFERLFKSYYAGLCDYGNGFLGDREMTEDVVQDAFIYIWNHREQIDLKISIKAYLYTSVRHGALNVIKKQLLERRHHPLLTEFIEYLETTEYSEEEFVDIEKVKRVMDQLPLQCKTVLEKSCVDGKKYKEIAEELNISINTVKTHIVKAHRFIREALGRDVSPILLFMALSL